MNSSLFHIQDLHGAPQEAFRHVTLSGSPGGTYSAQPAGLDIDPVTGVIAPATKYCRVLYREIYIGKFRRERSSGGID